MRTIAIGQLGLGNVGAGTVALLRDNRAAIEARLAAQVQVRRILVRNLKRPRDVDVDPSLLTTSVDEILGDPQIQVVVELIGGIEPARTYILQALRAGKHIVTANKALLAEYGAEIFAEAAARGLSVYFEGSVAGGIPIIRSLREGLASDRIEAITGIVNGTSNYILDAMTRTGATYTAALQAAQEAGFAEADPTLDVGGGDAAHKLALLALVSFGVRVDPAAIPTEGITDVSPLDIETAHELGYVIKSLAIAQRTEAGLSLRVHPTLVPHTHVLSDVEGSYNACLVQSRALGHSLYYGRGAGMLPTGVAVVSDIIEVCRNISAGTSSPPVPNAGIVEGTPLPLDNLVSENYLCLHVPNQPGMLGKCATCLGHHGVSIKRMIQNAPQGPNPVPMVIFTEPVEEQKIAAAIAEMATLDILGGVPIGRIRVLNLGETD